MQYSFALKSVSIDTVPIPADKKTYSQNSHRKDPWILN